HPGRDVARGLIPLRPIDLLDDGVLLEILAVDEVDVDVLILVLRDVVRADLIEVLLRGEHHPQLHRLIGHKDALNTHAHRLILGFQRGDHVFGHEVLLIRPRRSDRFARAGLVAILPARLVTRIGALAVAGFGAPVRAGLELGALPAAARDRDQAREARSSNHIADRFLQRILLHLPVVYTYESRAEAKKLHGVTHHTNGAGRECAGVSRGEDGGASVWSGIVAVSLPVDGAPTPAAVSWAGAGAGEERGGRAPPSRASRPPPPGCAAGSDAPMR